MAQNDTSGVRQQTEGDIQRLEPMKHVRLRPGMYVGGVDSKALHHLVYEVVDNSIDEALAGRCDHIIVNLHDDNYVSVADNGGGIPVGMNASTGRPTVEGVMTVIGMGGKFGSGAYKVSGGLHGVGVSAVNALSSHMKTTVYREGYQWEQTYEMGEVTSEVTRVRPLQPGEGTGTVQTFKPDFTIMEPNEFKFDVLADRFREMAFVTRRVTITLRDERVRPIPREITYYFEGGLQSFVRYINRHRAVLHEAVYAEKDIAITPDGKNPFTIGVEVAFQYNDTANITEMAFANTINTPDGGTHLTGLRAALTGVINRYARKAGYLKDKDPNFSGLDTLEGLTAIVSIKHPSPSFESQTKVKLINPEVQGAVSQVVTETFTEFLELNSREARKIIDKCMTSMRAREAARKARDLVRSGPSLLESSTLPGKLADCSKKGPGSEIYIVEGDSAGGCFSGDTRVALADGRNLSFMEIVAEQAEGKEHFCYTIRKDGKIGLERIINPRITKRNAQVVRVTLDNGETIVCTPDHRFMLRDGSYKPAAELASNDSIMPLYRKHSSREEKGITIDGYEVVWDSASSSWLFTHKLADWYNRWTGVYEQSAGDHCHHLDFNKLNNNPTNIRRMPESEHLTLHRKHASKTLHTPQAIAKVRAIHQTSAFRLKIKEKMLTPALRQLLSERAKRQWDNTEYKAYMMKSWRTYYASSPEYQEANRKMLYEAQQAYWADEQHRREQAERTTTYFAHHPEARTIASDKATAQWQDVELLQWRQEKTKEQWTPEFRQQRKQTLDKTYYTKTLQALKEIERSQGFIDLDAYQEYRLKSGDRSVLRFDRFCERYFGGDTESAKQAVSLYNHRIISIEQLEERIDVYDIEVPHSHNFALASGVFVHNSAKQGRDRHFQAILPLRGKILNTERARLDKMLDNNEIKAIIAALGTGISEDFKIENLRYDRILLMSVAKDEPTLVMDDAGKVEYVQVGTFIDECMDGLRSASRYQVMCFDVDTHRTRFRPLKAVIRHTNEEPLYHITTRYHRSIKVTASHSVFVLEDGQVILKKGDAIRPGDKLVATRRIPRSTEYIQRLDLLNILQQTGLTDNLYVRGESVRKIAATRVLSKVSQPEQWSEARVELDNESWKQLVAQRQQRQLTQKEVATSIGVKQAITISQWERGQYRPILPQFMGYLQTIGWDDKLEYTIIPSKIDRRLQQDDHSRNARWREVSAYKSLGKFTADELNCLDDQIELVPQAHEQKAFGRYLPVNQNLLYFLGWFAAEGSLSKHQVSLNLGEKDMPFLPQLTQAIESLFGETPRIYRDKNQEGIKFYFHSVAAARFLQAIGLAEHAHQKHLPDLVLNVSEDLQYAFLQGYFLGDGTISRDHISFTTNSPELKNGLLYLLGQLGLIGSARESQPQQNDYIQSRHPFFTITITGKNQVMGCRAIWGQHASAPRLDAYLAATSAKSANFTPISDDLMGLEVLSVEAIAPTSEYVYDFSVEKDENFVCGVGGLCAHNTDADVDGSHIKTLLLTFFFRHMPQLVQEGHIYIAQPPIFRLKHGKNVEYILPQTGVSENDLLAQALKKYDDPTKVGVQRYKGLGEMNADQLWDTTMNPATRTILQVTIDDAAAADQIFDMLMGSNVAPRRRFIQTHAKSVRNLDI